MTSQSLNRACGVDVLPGERRPFQLEQPFTVEEVVGLADKMRGRRRAALLAYAQLLQREPDVSDLIATSKDFGAMYERTTFCGDCWDPEEEEPEYTAFLAALDRIGGAA